jgi:hypothetical protein
MLAICWIHLNVWLMNIPISSTSLKEMIAWLNM